MIDTKRIFKLYGYYAHCTASAVPEGTVVRTESTVIIKKPNENGWLFLHDGEVYDWVNKVCKDLPYADDADHGTCIAHPAAFKSKTLVYDAAAKIMKFYTEEQQQQQEEVKVVRTVKPEEYEKIKEFGSF